jgi:hypothetical protein
MKKAAAIVAMLAIGMGVYFLWLRGPTVPEALVAKLKASRDDTPERAAARQAIVEAGQSTHPALFAMLREEPVEVCQAIPFETFTFEQLQDSYRAMGEGGQAAVAIFVADKLKANESRYVALIETMLAAKSPTARRIAVVLAALPTVKRPDLVMSHIRDVDAEVRVTALSVLAPRSDLISDEALFPALHDGDSRVRATVSNVLMARGRSPEDILLAIKLLHPAAAMRRELVADLKLESAVRDVSPWLERLGSDDEASVRFAAMSLAAELKLPWHDWMAKLENDANDSVRRTAITYHRQTSGVIPAGFEQK